MPLLKRPVCLQSQSASGYVPRTILQFNWTRDQLIQHFNHYNHILGLRWYLPCALHISDHISLEVVQNRIKFVNSSCSHIGDVIFVGVMIVSISLSLAPSSNCLCTFFVYVTRLCFRKNCCYLPFSWQPTILPFCALTLLVGLCSPVNIVPEITYCPLLCVGWAMMGNCNC